MKTLLTTILSTTLFFSLFGQTKTDFDNMTTVEIRKFLLQQNESEPAKILTKKHNVSRITSYSLLVGSLVFAISSSDSSNDPGLQSGTVLTGLLAGVMFIGSGLTGIAASERLKKAKSVYLTGGTNTIPSASISMIRNDGEIMKSIFKYPTTH